MLDIEAIQSAFYFVSTHRQQFIFPCSIISILSKSICSSFYSIPWESSFLSIRISTSRIVYVLCSIDFNNLKQILMEKGHCTLIHIFFQSNFNKILFKFQLTGKIVYLFTIKARPISIHQNEKKEILFWIQ